MKKMVSVVMTAILIAIPVTPAFALTNNDTVKEKAQELASKIVSDYGASGLLADSNQVDIDQPLTTYIKDFKMADDDITAC